MALDRKCNRLNDVFPGCFTLSLFPLRFNCSHVVHIVLLVPDEWAGGRERERGVICYAPVCANAAWLYIYSSTYEQLHVNRGTVMLHSSHLKYVLLLLPVQV